MKLASFIAALACFSAFAGNAAEMTFKPVGGLDIPAQYRSCQADADCTVVADVCSRWSWHPINKSNVKAAQALYRNVAINCESGNYSQPATACVKGSCVLAPDKEQCLFHINTPESACRIKCNEKDANGICQLPDEQP